MIGTLAGRSSETHPLVGGGGDRAKYERHADRAGARPRVHFAGATEDVSGVAIIEAMAAGIRVVTTTDAGAAGEPGAAGAGIVRPEGSPALLREALPALVSDRCPHRELGERNRRPACAFSIGNHVDRVASSFERVAKVESAGAHAGRRMPLLRRGHRVR